MRSWLARFGVLVLAVALLLAGSASGADVYWAVPLNQTGDWSVASNWGRAVPGKSDDAYVANGGTATISMPGETCSQLFLGGFEGTGNIEMTGGNAQLSASNAYIAEYAPGAFTQSGGTDTVANLLYIGYGSIGTYSLSGSGLLSAGTINVGNYTDYIYYSPGTFTQSGNTKVLANSLNLEGGTYNSTDNGLLSAGSISVGGSFVQSGSANVFATSLILGNDSGGYGTYSLSGNALLSTSNLFLGYALSTGFLTQSGGTIAVADNLFVGDQSRGCSYSLAGNALLSASNLYVGGSALAIMTQSGGTVVVNSLYTRGAYNLNGGLLVLSNITCYAYGLNFTGGTIEAGGTFSTNEPLSLNAPGGNATIDTEGYAVTFSGALSGPGNLIKTGSGTLILSGTNTYTGGTTVLDGTLIIDSSAAIESRTNLTVGDASAFAAPIVPSEPAADTSPGSSVPEPGTLALIAAAAVTLAGYGLRRRRRRKGKLATDEPRVEHG